MSERRGRVLTKVQEDVCILTIDSPDSRNALSTSMLQQLAHHVSVASSQQRGVVVTGADFTFSSGDDLTEIHDVIQREGIEYLSSAFDAVTEAVTMCEVPCIAALNGPAIGGAAGLTLAFDRRIGTHRAAMAFPESRVGFTISNATSLLLPELVGRTCALDLVLSGRSTTASECLQLGLIDEIVEPNARSSLLDRCVDVIKAWTQPGNTSSLHLRLVRPDMDGLRAAFTAERAAAAVAWNADSMSKHITRFDGSS